MAAVAPARAAPSAVAVRRSGPVDIDGRLDDAAWSAAPVQGGFHQREPHPDRPPEFVTEFRVLYDDTAIFVGVRAHDPEPSLIQGRLTRRDVDSSSDWISIKIDSYHDRRTAFGFSVNPAGVKRDVLHFNDIESDDGWDAVWEAGTSIDQDGWTAEVRIPYSQLRFPRAPQQEWGFQVLRRVQRTQELSSWASWPRTVTQEVSLYGTVTGIDRIASTRRIELLPYARAGAEISRARAGDPLDDDIDPLYGAGMDLKMGLGPSFTVSATVNPDFGQVEADPSQVNLSDTEIFFAEKRPFFLEGTDIFRYSLGQGDGDGSIETLFYSRRIGAPPHADAAEDHDFATQPDATTIYGAAKISGKTADGWSVGLLDAITGQEEALTAMEGSTDRDRVVVEPFSNYAVGRVRKDLRDGRTTVGGAVTAVNRSLDGLELDWLHEQAYAGGLELAHRWADDAWTADLRLAGSHVRGSAAALDRTQTSSVHYFQRPDADHLDYDPTRTSLSGTQLLWSVGKTGGSRWRGVLGGNARTPGFEANDLGFQRSSDEVMQFLWLQVRQDQPGDLLREWSVNQNDYVLWDTSGELLSWGGNVNGSASLLSYWGGSGGVNWTNTIKDPSYLRGGPMLKRDLTYNGWVSAWTDVRRTVYASVGANAFIGPESGSSGRGLSAAINLQPRPNVELSLGPSVSSVYDDNQYVTEQTDSMGQPHYVLARLHQVTTALTLRASYTFSPTLSLQIYAQPFVSTGRFREYKEADQPRAEDYDNRYHTYGESEIAQVDGERVIDRDGDGATDYSFDAPDFNVRELRSNVVLRWEYRPGSTFFFIWSHGRTSAAGDGTYALGDELTGLADEPGEHVVMAKLTYWLGS